MMRITAVVSLFPDLGQTELVAWIERGWVRPDQPDTDPIFRDIDVARVRLIHDLRTVMLVEDETMPLVLSLLDQVYETRTRLRSVLRAVEAQPEPVRRAILAAMN